MTRFVSGGDRHQITLLPDRRDDYVSEDNPVRVVDLFMDELDLAALGFAGVLPAATGRPGYHPATLLKLVSLKADLPRAHTGSHATADHRGASRSVARPYANGPLQPARGTSAVED